MLKAWQKWLDGVLAEHASSPEPDGSVTVACTQTELAKEAGVSKGTISAYLRQAETAGILVSRKPLRFTTAPSARSRPVERTGVTVGAQAGLEEPVQALADLLTEPDALSNPWARRVAAVIDMLTGLAQPDLAVRVPDRERARTGTRELREVATQDSAVSRSFPETDQTRPDVPSSLSPSVRSTTRETLASSRDKHSQEQLARWVGLLQETAEKYQAVPPSRLEPLFDLFSQYPAVQVDRAVSLVCEQTASRKVTSPAGILVKVGQTRWGSPERLEYFGAGLVEAVAEESGPNVSSGPEFREYVDEDGTRRVEIIHQPRQVPS